MHLALPRPTANGVTDLGKLTWIKELIDEVKELFTLIKNHQAPRAAWKVVGSYVLELPIDSRFKYQFVMLACALKNRADLVSLFGNKDFMAWEENQTAAVQATLQRFRASLLNRSWCGSRQHPAHHLNT